MGEIFKPDMGLRKEEIREEEIEKKKERLIPIFERSREFLEELEITRKRPDGRIEKLSGLVVMEINEDGPEVFWIDRNGDPTNSGTLLWIEIIDANPESR